MIEVVAAGTDGTLMEFAEFPKRLYSQHGLRLPALPAETLALLRHETPFTEGRRFHPLLVRDCGRVVGRAAAVLDGRYNEQWQERLGHIILLEAGPDSPEAAQQLIQAACDWLGGHGCVAVRAGYGPFEPGFVIDDYSHVIRRLWRHTLPYYHALLKGAGFETEKGGAEYVIRVTPELASRYRQYSEHVRGRGIDIVSLRTLPDSRGVEDFTRTWNAAYASHWGMAPMLERELASLLAHHRDSATPDLSAVAYRAGEPVGVVLVLEEPPHQTLLARALSRRPPGDGLSNFAVGVCPAARGSGIAVALASHAVLAADRTGRHAPQLRPRGRRQHRVAAHGREARCARLCQLRHLSEEHGDA